MLTSCLSLSKDNLSDGSEVVVMSLSKDNLSDGSEVAVRPLKVDGTHAFK